MNERHISKLLKEFYELYNSLQNKCTKFHVDIIFTVFHGVKSFNLAPAQLRILISIWQCFEN